MNWRNPVFTRAGRIDCEIEHPAYGWIPTTLAADDPETAELFATVSAGEVAPAPAPVLADVKVAKLAEINTAYTSATAPLVSSYPEIERLSWPQQQRDATEYQAWLDAGGTGDAPATPVLDNILTGRNAGGGTETLAELAGKVLTNAQMFIDAQELTGKRHRLEKAIQQAETGEAVEAVVW